VLLDNTRRVSLLCVIHDLWTLIRNSPQLVKQSLVP